MTEIFQVQGDISAQVSGYLQITLTEADKDELSYIPTRFISAYDYYLKASNLSAVRTVENSRAIELLQKAIVIDPEFVEAWSALSFRYTKKTDDLNEGKHWLDSAVYYASRALKISPASATANGMMGFALMYKRDLDKATVYLKKADKLNPSLGSPLRPLSSIQLIKGQLDSAYYFARELIHLNQHPHGGYSQMARIFLRLGQWDSCRFYFAKELETHTLPVSSATGRDMGIYGGIDFYIKAGEYTTALKLIEDNFMNEQDPARLWEKDYFLKTIYALRGDWENFSKVVTESETDWLALLHKRTNNEPGFEKAMAKLKESDQGNRNLILLSDDFTPLIEESKTLSENEIFKDYQHWLSDPFASEFVKTREFKELFSGYDNWTRQMLASIQRMSKNKYDR